MFSQSRRIIIGCTFAIMLASSFQAVFADTEANKAVIERWLEFWTTADLAIADEIFATDFVSHIPHYPDAADLEGYKEEVAKTPTTVTGFSATIEDMIAEGDKVAGRFTATGTMQPFGVQYTNTWIIMFRFAGDKIVEEWWEFDLLGVQQQLGVIPPMPEGPPAMQRAAPEDFMWSAPSDVTGDPGDSESNKAVVQREFEAWNQGDVDSLLTVLDEIYTANFVYHDPSRPHVTDLASYKKWAAEECFAPFPDLDMPVDDIIAEGDKVAVRWTFSGTHIGLGREVTQTGITIARIADGKVVEAWCACEMLGAIQQLTTPEWPIAGSWISIVPIPGLGDIVGVLTVSPQDSGGTNFTSALRAGKPEATVFGAFPDADHQSDHIGQMVKTGLNTYESTAIGYGTKKSELPGMLPEIVYISVLYAKSQLIDENTMKGQGTHAFYVPSQDADGDGLPDEGQEPVACFPYISTAKRVQLMPPCVPPPPPEPEGE